MDSLAHLCAECVDIWGPALILYPLLWCHNIFPSCWRPLLSDCLRIRKVIRLVFVSKHDLGSCQQDQHQEDFTCSSHNKSSQQVMFSVKPDGEKKRAYCWMDMIPPAPNRRVLVPQQCSIDLKLWMYFQARLTFPAESVQAVYDDAANSAARAGSCSGGRTRSGRRPQSVCLSAADGHLSSQHVSAFVLNSCCLLLNSLFLPLLHFTGGQRSRKHFVAFWLKDFGVLWSTATVLF